MSDFNTVYNIYSTRDINEKITVSNASGIEKISLIVRDLDLSFSEILKIKTAFSQSDLASNCNITYLGNGYYQLSLSHAMPYSGYVEFEFIDTFAKFVNFNVVVRGSKQPIKGH